VGRSSPVLYRLWPHGGRLRSRPILSCDTVIQCAPRTPTVQSLSSLTTTTTMLTSSPLQMDLWGGDTSSKQCCLKIRVRVAGQYAAPRSQTVCEPSGGSLYLKYKSVVCSWLLCADPNNIIPLYKCITASDALNLLNQITFWLLQAECPTVRSL
jgi:hypothetical protein